MTLHTRRGGDRPPRKGGDKPSGLSIAVLVVTLVATTVAAQTKVTPPKNKYTPEQDVQIGREAAAEVRREYPLINDSTVDNYLDRLGNRLVAASPDGFVHGLRSLAAIAGKPETSFVGV